MSHPRRRRCAGSVAAAAVVALTLTIGLGSARADNIIDEWASVKAPPPPALKPVTADPKTTALLMLDFMQSNCGRRPRCVASLPAVKALLAAARASGALVIYTTVPPVKMADTMPDVAPTGSEPVVTSWVDKFNNTDLEKILKEKGITTVIAVGTAAHGAVLHTASAAAIRGLKVIVPVDGMSMEPYSEQYTAWHLANAPVVSPNVTLTKIDMVKF